MRAFWNGLEAPLAGDLCLFGGTLNNVQAQPIRTSRNQKIRSLLFQPQCSRSVGVVAFDVTP